MFNSKKKAAAATSEALQAQREESAALRAQLESVIADKSTLERQLAQLSQANDAVLARLDALDHGVTDLGERVDDVDVHVAKLRPLTSPSATPPPPPPPPPPPAIVGVGRRHDELDQRLDELRQRLDELSESTSAIDARVTNVSTELAHQLTELSNDIEELNRRNADAAAATSAQANKAAELGTAELEARIAERIDAALHDVHGSTERLAAEQARYEIQFRADLAELADRLRRPSGY